MLVVVINDIMSMLITHTSLHFFYFLFCFRISNASVLVLSLFVKNKDYFGFGTCVDSFMPC